MKKINKPIIKENGEIRFMQQSDRFIAIPLRDDFPELTEYAEKRKVGRPKSANAKQQKTFRLSPDLIAHICATAGYNLRVETILREAMEQGRI